MADGQSVVVVVLFFVVVGGFLFCLFAYGLIFTIFLQFTGALFIFKEVTTEVICNLQEE